MKKIFPIILLVVLSPAITFAACIEGGDVADCYTVDGDIYTTIGCEDYQVAAAVAAAQTAGGAKIVSVPSGSCTWNNKVTITGGIHLRGAGIDATNITCATATGAGAGDQSILWNVTGEDPPRLSGFTFLETGSNYTYPGIIQVDATPAGWRIDHNEFNGMNGRVVQFGGNLSGPGTRGSIDANQITNTGDVNTNCAIRLYGDPAAWTEATTLSSDDAVSIENNNFSHSSAVTCALDMESGAKAICRYNDMLNYRWAQHGLEGTMGALKTIILNNEATYTATASSASFLQWRGGVMVAGNNTVDDTALGDDDNVTGEGNELWVFGQVMYYCSADVVGCHDDVEGVELCTGGYPCKNQQSRTYNQGLQASYFYGNTYNGYSYNTLTMQESAASPIISIEALIQSDRDYYVSDPSVSWPACPNTIAATQDGLSGSCSSAVGLSGYNIPQPSGQATGNGAGQAAGGGAGRME